MSGMPLRGDRIHRYVNAFCPVCHEERPDRPLAEVQRLSGWLVERDDRIWLERGCATHGLVRTMYDESPEILTYLEQWTAPTKRHEPDVRGNFKPVPAAYGVFRFLVELVRGNDVAWAGLTRPQLFLLVTVPLVLARIVWQARRGAYRDAMRPRELQEATR